MLRTHIRRLSLQQQQHHQHRYVSYTVRSPIVNNVYIPCNESRFMTTFTHNNIHSYGTCTYPGITYRAFSHNTMNRDDKHTKTMNDMSKLASLSSKELHTSSSSGNNNEIDTKKLTIWQRVKKEARHYWLGFKLLGLNIRTSYGIIQRVLHGHELSRRERRMLKNVVIDLFRLVPFAVFLIVPFMEFLLPLALRYFPQMLPSTFDDKLHQQEALAKKVRAKITVAKFLQESVEEMVNKHTPSRSSNTPPIDVEAVMLKLRRGEVVDNETVMAFAEYFEDELTLDNLDRPQLVALCRFLSLRPYGSNTLLRTFLRNRINSIKRDDLLIYSEGGVPKLTKAELREACLTRGMKIWGSKERLQKQLTQWLVSSVEQRVPTTLLILSRALTMFERDRSTEEGIKEVLSSLPEEIIDEIELQIAEARGSSDRDLKLEVMQANVEKVAEERQEVEEDERDVTPEKEEEDLKLVATAVEELLSGRSVDQAVLEAAKERSMKLLQEMEGRSVEKVTQTVGEVIEELDSTTRQEGEQMTTSETPPVVETTTTATSTTTTSTAKAPPLPEAAVEETPEPVAASGTESVEEQEAKVEEYDLKVASRVAKGLSRIFEQLEGETAKASSELGAAFRLLDLDGDGVLSQDELRSALIRLREKLTNEEIQDIISKLDDDHDGRISLEAVLQYKHSEDDLIEQVARLKEERDNREKVDLESTMVASKLVEAEASRMEEEKKEQQQQQSP